MVLTKRVVNPHAPSSSDGRSERPPEDRDGTQGIEKQHFRASAGPCSRLGLAGPDRFRVSGPGVPGSLRVVGLGLGRMGEDT